MNERATNPGGAMSPAEFDSFYAAALPVVYGYLLRLCGRADDAWDLTQDTWVALADRLALGEWHRATVPWLLTVARHRFLDSWRRDRRLERKLSIVWASQRTHTDPEIDVREVLDRVQACAPDHRVVLVLAYVDDLPVAEIARLLGMPQSSTYALLSRARDELRRRIEEERRV